MQNVWQVWPDRGFLINPDPVGHLSEVESGLPEETIDQVEATAAELPALLAGGRLRPRLDALPVFDFGPLQADWADRRLLERVMLLYAYFASAYIHAPGDNGHHLPAGVARPLVQAARMLKRPPILSYAAMVMGNWRRVDPDGGLDMENLEALQTFLGLPDERWFILVHVAIEAQAAPVLRGIVAAFQAVRDDDPTALQDALRAINWGLVAMTRTFHQMPQGCDPDVYYREVRPYMFGFTDVIFSGVDEFGGQPQTLRGGSGAQSSIVPALVAALGIRHEATELMQHLAVMRDYMPPEHRRFIDQVESTAIRDYVDDKPPLIDAYNACIRQLITFRRAHFYYARTYIFEKSTNPVGTGGTVFMEFLDKLIAEAEAHLL